MTSYACYQRSEDYPSLTITDHPYHRIVTRSHKQNDRDHQGIADGTAAPEQHLPRYFAKSGHAGVDPSTIKKGGAGKANWGRSGDELDDESFNLTNARRRSNSSVENTKSFKSKFETIDPEPVFEEEIHGDGGIDHYNTEGGAQEAEHHELDKQSSFDSTESTSTTEEGEAAAPEQKA